MNMTLSKGGAELDASPFSLKVASPGRKGLYGKKPLANTRMAHGIKMFAKSTAAFAARGIIAPMKTESPN